MIKNTAKFNAVNITQKDYSDWNSINDSGWDSKNYSDSDWISVQVGHFTKDIMYKNWGNLLSKTN